MLEDFEPTLSVFYVMLGMVLSLFFYTLYTLTLFPRAFHVSSCFIPFPSRLRDESEFRGATTAAFFTTSKRLQGFPKKTYHLDKIYCASIMTRSSLHLGTNRNS